MPVELREGGGATITGAAIQGYRAALMEGSLRLYAETGYKTHSSFRLGDMLSMATAITGKTYGKSKKGALAAADDLRLMLDSTKGLEGMGQAIEAGKKGAV